jgi:PAS domain S-box-containing protein
VAFALVFTVLVGTGIASFVISDRTSLGEELVAHTYEVISLLKDVEADLSGTVSARRGYELTGDSTMLIEYDVGVHTIPERLQQVRSQAADNSVQQQNLAQLQPMVSQRLALLAQSVELQRQNSAATDQQLEYTRQGAALDDKIRAQLKAMEAEEFRLLHLRSSMSSIQQRRAVLFLVFFFLLASMLLVSLFLMMSAEAARRTKAEEAAQENEEKYRLLVSGVQDHAIIRVNLEGRIITWNQGAQRLFGYDSQEILGMPFWRLYHACQDETPKRHLTLALEKGHVNDECQQVRKDGAIFWATADVTLLRGDDGEARGYAVITRDITERKLQREEIEQREAELNAFFTNAPVGLAVLDKDLCFQRINRPFAELNGLVPGEHVGRPLEDVTSVLSLQIKPMIRHVAATGGQIINQEIKGPHPGDPDGSGWWLKSFFPIARKNDQVTQIGAIVQDITMLKRAEYSVRSLSSRLLQIRDDERRRLARDLHDSLGQMLTALKMNLSYVNRDTSTLGERASTAISESMELVEVALKEVRTLSHLLHPPMLDEVGLVAAIRWYANGFAQRSGIQVELDLPSALGRLPTDLETAVFRVVQESLTNVHRHSASPTAAVRLQTEEGNLHLFVSDQGCGIPPEKLASSQDGANGTIGVGLLGMRERLRQLDGKLEISSTGQGTQIHATIPIT